MKDWSEFYVSFLRHMHDEHYWEVDDVLAFFEKPWKWNSEIEKWVHDNDSKCGVCYEDE